VAPVRHVKVWVFLVAYNMHYITKITYIMHELIGSVWLTCAVYRKDADIVK